MPGQFAEADLLPISALQHLIYCERQCALIHNERLWAENRLTVEGRQLHEKTHDPTRGETRPGVRITRGLPMRSLRLGIVGQADVVEFHEPDDSSSPAPPRIVPVEYKRGRPKKHDADKVQLCAQALCLEEMLNLSTLIDEGALYYGKTRRRQSVLLDQSMRGRTLNAIHRLHELIESRQTPPARYEKSKCDRCSLRNQCMPQLLRPRRTAERVFEELLSSSLLDEGHP